VQIGRGPERHHDSDNTESGSYECGFFGMSTSDALVSLILGFAIFAGSRVSHPPLLAKVLLALSLVALLLASVFGLEISRPTSGYYTPVAVKDLRLAVEPTNWTGEQTEAARQLAVYQVSELDSWRNGNGLKANALYR
jgi:hypothetical protein